MASRRDILKFWPSALAVFGTVSAITAFVQPDPSGLLFCVTITIIYLVGRITFQHYSETKWDRQGRDLFHGLSTPAYLEWQQEILETLYCGLEIATVYGRRYPAAIIRPSLRWQYPFSGLCELTEVELPKIQISKKQKAYIKMLGRSLKWPHMKGFALRRIRLDDQSRADVIDVVTTNFLQNVITTHFLEWELYKFYNENRLKLKDLDQAKILEHLSRRAIYHNGRPGRLAVLEPVSAYPLIGLQALVVFRDTRTSSNPIWRIITAKRSNEVVVRPGFFQFQPAGGFEVYGTEDDDDDYLVSEGFDLTAALFREFSEELFDAKHLQVKPDSRDPSSVLSDPHIQQLLALIDIRKAFVDYLGVVIDLAILKHDLSFMILIADENFCRNPFLGSWEAKNILGIPPQELRSVLSQGMLSGNSAALLQLAMESERLRELGISKDLTGT